MNSLQRLTSLVALAILLTQVPVARAVTVLGTGNSALIGRDLTDPENDGLPDANTNYNAVFSSTNKAFFGAPEGSFNVFDNLTGGSNNKWCCDGAPHQLTADFGAGNAKILKAFTLTSSNDTPARDPVDWQIEGSNDNSSWTTIFDSNATNYFSATRDQVVYFGPADFTNTTAYQYLRYNVATTGGSNHALAEIEYFDYTEGHLAKPGTIIGGLLGNDLTDPENDGAADANTNYNATFASTNEAGFGGGEFSFNVFDNLVGAGNDKWCCDAPPAGGHKLDATFATGHRLLAFTLTSSNDSPDRDPLNFEIQGSNDGVNFSTIFAYDGAFGPLWTARSQTLLFRSGIDYADQSNIAYSTFRYLVTSSVGGWKSRIGRD